MGLVVGDIVVGNLLLFFCKRVGVLFLDILLLFVVMVVVYSYLLLL